MFNEILSEYFKARERSLHLIAELTLTIQIKI